MVDNPVRVIYNKHENRPCAAAADTMDRIAALLAQAQQRLDELAGLTGQSVKWESIADKPGLAPSLALKDGQLAVVTAAAAEQDNPLPITSAAVHAQLGQVNALLASI